MLRDMAGADTSEIHDDVVLAMELQREGSVGLSLQGIKDHGFAGFQLNEVVPTAASFAVDFLLEVASPERSSVGAELASVVTPIARKCVADGGELGFLSLSEAVA